MEQAAFLLCNSTLHITDIAFSSGYNSRQHFAHTFEKFYHMSPSRYRSLAYPSSSLGYRKETLSYGGRTEAGK
ncbi:MAG: helix-turn-helix domain-containing protein [Blautia massiliensis (ex Durand et al. 2017)]